MIKDMKAEGHDLTLESPELFKVTWTGNKSKELNIYLALVSIFYR